MFLYTYFSDAWTVLGVLCVAKYIYGEDLTFKRKSWCMLIIGYILGEMLCNIFLPWYEYGLAFIVPALILFIRRKKARIWGALLVIPSLLILWLPYCMMLFLFMVLTDGELMTIVNHREIAFCVDLFWGVIIAWVNYRNKKSKGLFMLNRWDRTTLICIAILVYITLFGLDNLRVEDVLKQYETSISIFTLIVISMLLIAGVMSIIKNKSMHYYKDLIKVHSYYMEAQFKHFEAYKQSQKEVGKIKHDLKNHMLCIEQLIKEKKYEQLEEYIEGLVGCVEEINKNIYTGHDIVDAILQEKQETAKKQEVEIQIDGFFQVINHLKPVDVCTLIANGVDNAIEAASQMENKVDRWVKISIETNDNHMILKMTNPVNKKVFIHNNKVSTTKMDKKNHGYGLENIHQVVEKYEGELVLSCEFYQETKTYQFSLEVFLAIPD